MDVISPIVCKQLRFALGRIKPRAHYGEGTGQIWQVDETFECSDDAQNVLDCSFGKLMNRQCYHNLDIGIECGKNIKFY